MGLLLAEGKRLTHLKEKPQHNIPYHDFSVLWRRDSAADATDARQPQGFLYHFMMKMMILIIFVFFFPSNGAPVE
jgi:hypothetical protein